MHWIAPKLYEPPKFNGTRDTNTLLMEMEKKLNVTMRIDALNTTLKGILML